MRTVRFGDINLVGAVDRPDVAVRVIRLGRAIGARRVSRREKNLISGGKEVAAGGAPLACTDKFGRGGFAVGGVYGHGVDLVARHIGTLVLENELFIVGRKIGLGVLPAESKLANVFQVLSLFGQEKRFSLFFLSV